MVLPRASASLLIVAGVVLGCGARTALDDTEFLGGTADAAADASLDATSDGPIACVPGTFTLNRALPTVMFVVDRSSSMSQPFGGGASRWTVLSNALASTLPAADSAIQLGALIFPARGGGMTCALPASADLAPATGNVDAFVSLMRASGPSGSTPTASALDLAATALGGVRAATGARAMVLATDGGPCCNSTLDGNTCRCLMGSCRNRPERCLDDVATVHVIATHAASGIPTYVIGIEGTEDQQYGAVLDAMAVAGERPRSGSSHRYYSAGSETELDDALVTIRNQVGACTYLSTSVPSADGSISVTLGGALLPFDPTGQRGWRWGNQANGEIILAGDTCGAAGTSAGALVVTVSCTPARLDASVDVAPSDAATSDEDADPDATP